MRGHCSNTATTTPAAASQPPQPQAPQPQPQQPSQPSQHVGAECCTASIPGNHLCEMCYPGSALSGDHWCANSEDRCGHCSGTWCANSAQKAYRLYEDVERPPGGVLATQFFSTCSLSGTRAIVLFLGLFSVAWLRFGREHQSEGYRHLQQGRESMTEVSVQSEILTDEVA